VNVFIHSLGCRLNQSEMEELAQQLTAAGQRLVAHPAQADVCVLNTCAVTAEAERKSCHTVRALARANPRARIAVLGCAATLAPHRYAGLPGVAWVLANADKASAAERIAGVANPPTDGVPIATGGAPPLLRTRALVKVQEGCDQACTYCITRFLRGPARSRPVEGIVAQVNALAAAGVQEAVLTGVNLGAYGRDLGLASGLRGLVEALLARTGIPRLRLSSLEPWDVDEGFLALWADPRLCRQLHLPLQSGCDQILRRMARPISTQRFASIAKRARALVPDLALTTDILVGFPGEDEAAFRASYDFVAGLEFARLHVFPFSPRPGTAAADMPEQVAPPVRQERAREMRELGQQQSARFHMRFLGRTVAVLWEARGPDGRWCGLTDNYLRVLAHSEADWHNRITRVRLVACEGECLIAEPVE
jgi:threonylcarbamoyladenosine tRNA methylthiotransferase MtaB